MNTEDSQNLVFLLAYVKYKKVEMHCSVSYYTLCLGYGLPSSP